LAAPAWRNNDFLWLWVPAFAGTTPNFWTRLRISRAANSYAIAPPQAGRCEADFGCTGSTKLHPRLCLLRQRCVPAQAFERSGARLVFASDPAAIADRVEVAEQEGIVDLAGTGLVAAGIVRELDMTDAPEMLLQGARDVALH